MRLFCRLQFATFIAFFALAGASPAKDDHSTLDQWMHNEQTLLDRNVDTEKITAPDVQNQAFQYRPDSGQWFPVKSIWLPESELDVVELESMIPTELRPELIRIHNGQKQFRFFIHPESENLYRNWLSKYPVVTDYRATATSSSRTLLVESTRDPSKKFFAKLSLDLQLGGSDRTIPNNEIARSVGTTQYFVDHQKNASDGFKIVPEVLGLSPQGRYRGGMIIRLIPDEVLNGTSKLVPLFSLYARNGEKPTLIEKMAHEARMTPHAFSVEKILKPFAKAWSEWAVKGGLVAEDHAQNVMLELDSAGNPTGKFFLRDGGGFYINPHSPTLNAGELSKLPTLNGFQWDYQKFADVAEGRSLDTYFAAGFLHNLDAELARLEPSYRKGEIYDDFWKQIASDLGELSGDPTLSFRRYQLENDMPRVLKTVREASTGQKYRPLEFGLGRPLRIGVYTGTFDPPHAGHVQALEAAREKAGLDLIYVIPNTATPHKPGALKYEDRKEMAKRAFRQDGIVIGNEAVEKAHQKGGIDEVLRSLMRSYDQGTHFYRIKGDDSLQYYLDHPNALTDPNITFLVIQRGGNQASEEALPKQIGKSKVITIAGSDLGYSSTRVREMIHNGVRPENVSESVWKYIQEKNLYPLAPDKNCFRDHVLGVIERH
jgi:nicotinate-nucleotide adenylyltransferase